jgi:serine/threonine protein kinase
MLKALCYLHKSKIVHRDLKPGNILLDTVIVDKYQRNFNVSVCDFGLAFQGSGGARSFVGTMDYMSPECIQQEGNGYVTTNSIHVVRNKADIWGVGCILYELISGVLPF